MTWICWLALLTPDAAPPVQQVLPPFTLTGICAEKPPLVEAGCAGEGPIVVEVTFAKSKVRVSNQPRVKPRFRVPWLMLEAPEELVYYRSSAMRRERPSKDSPFENAYFAFLATHLSSLQIQPYVALTPEELVDRRERAKEIRQSQRPEHHQREELARLISLGMSFEEVEVVLAPNRSFVRFDRAIFFDSGIALDLRCGAVAKVLPLGSSLDIDPLLPPSPLPISNAAWRGSSWSR